MPQLRLARTRFWKTCLTCGVLSQDYSRGLARDRSRETGYPATCADSGVHDGDVTLTMAADRARESPRVEGVFRVRYAKLDQLVVAYSADLSKGGVFLASEPFLPIHSTIRLVLELPGQGSELSISCRVVYLRDKITAERTGKT